MITALMSSSINFNNQYGSHLPKQGWSKYGGGIYGLLKEELDEWYCQICGDVQVKILPSYMFPVDESKRDFVRVCSTCKAKADLNHLTVLNELIFLIKG